MDELGVDDGGRYCVLDEEAIIEALVRDGWVFEMRAGNEASARHQAAQTLERWLAQGLPCRRQGSQRYFDFCQVVNFSYWTSVVHGDPTFEERMVRTARQLVAEGGPSTPTGRDVGQDVGPVRVVVRYRREFNLRDQKPGSVLRLRVPLPYPDHTQNDLSVALTEPASAGASVRTVPGLLEARYTVPDHPDTVAVAVEITFCARRESYDVEPGRVQAPACGCADYELYTRRSEGLIQVTASVVQLAQALAGSTTNAWEALTSFWAYFFQHLRGGRIHHEELDSRDPLGSLIRRGWFDCYAGAALLAALCRARGIAARIVSGLVLYPAVPFDHYWTEVWMPPYGWIPLDLFSWQLAGGRLEEVKWSCCFRGRLDLRMKTECFPHAVIGIPGVRVPPSWYLVPRLTAQGAQTSCFALPTRQLLYRDTVEVKRLA